MPTYRNIEIMLFDVTYDNGRSETVSFTKRELASFKRSNKWKKVLIAKRLFKLQVKISSI